MREATWNLSLFCPNGCAHCANAGITSDRRSVSPVQARRILSQLRDYGVRDIHLSAGEPFLYRGLMDEVVIPGNRLGILFEIATSGAGLGEKDLDRLLRSRRNNQLTLSLDGDTERVNDSIRFKGSFKRIIDCLDLIAERLSKAGSALSVVIRHTVTSANCTRIARFLRLMDKYPVDAVIVGLVEEEGNADAEMMLRPGRRLAAFERALAGAAAGRRYRVVYRNAPRSGTGELRPVGMPCYGQHSLYIDNLGDMVPCSRLLIPGTPDRERALEMFEAGFARPNILRDGLKKALKAPIFGHFNRAFDRAAVERRKFKACAACACNGQCLVCPLTLARVADREKAGETVVPCKEL